MYERTQILGKHYLIITGQLSNVSPDQPPGPLVTRIHPQQYQQQMGIFMSQTTLANDMDRRVCLHQQRNQHRKRLFLKRN